MTTTDEPPGLPAAPLTPRVRPCASCPYRCDVPSGLWAASEYAKLPGYDGETYEQNPRLFTCHQQDNTVCAGWLGHTDADQLLAVRLAVIAGRADPSCLDYRTDVPLWPSGRAAAAHGLRDVPAPGPDAQQAIDKITRVQAHARTAPVVSDPAGMVSQ